MMYILFILGLSILLVVAVSFLFFYRKKAYFERYSGQKNWLWLWDFFFFKKNKVKKPFSFAHFDIKEFKLINENFGHIIANRVLARIGIEARKEPWIKHIVRSFNDNFALVTDFMDEEELISKLLQFFNKIGTLTEYPDYKIYYRCGAVTAGHTVEDKETLVDFAKLAQIQGVQQNTTEVFIYTEKMKDGFLTTKRIVREIPRALKAKELIVYIQPKYNIKENTLSGGEALVRWNRRFVEFLFPGSFISYAEEAGFIHLIDFFVLETICQKLDEWRKQELSLVPLSVNISRQTITNPLFLKKAIEVVDQYDIPHELIEFELTESAFYENQDYIVSIMDSIKQEGFKLSMDDFGTGYSSLHLLQKMPLDTLKLDKSFVDNILNPEDAEEIFRAQVILKNILVMTHDMCIDSLAEGVEWEDQKKILERWGCLYVQGHYYNKAMPIHDFEALLQQES